MSTQITCVNKLDRSNPHERIISVGGADKGASWKLSQEEVIRRIEAGREHFHVSVGGSTVAVIVKTSASGNKYLCTEADKTTADNLLGLPECR